MSEQRIKGSLAKTLVETLREIIAQGDLAEEEAKARLSPEAIGLLNSTVQVIAWYPIGPYGELLDLLWEVAGGRRPESAVFLGFEAARNVVASSGMYGAFVDGFAKSDVQDVESLLRGARVAARLTDMFYDFLTARVDVDETGKALRITYEGTEPFTDAMVYATRGFLNGFFATARPEGREASGLDWTAQRPEPGRIVFAHDLHKLQRCLSRA